MEEIPESDDPEVFTSALKKKRGFSMVRKTLQLVQKFLNTLVGALGTGLAAMLIEYLTQ